MKEIDKKLILKFFDRTLYQIENPLFISSEEYWDGGYSVESSLDEKKKFYTLANEMSNIVKELIKALDEEIYISEAFCENSQLYAQWSDLKKHELFRAISYKIQRRKFYNLSLLEDEEIIDMIVESNFRYLTHISLFLPKEKIIIQPTCHTEIIIYTHNMEKISKLLSSLIPKHPCIEIK